MAGRTRRAGGARSRPALVADRSPCLRCSGGRGWVAGDPPNKTRAKRVVAERSALDARAVLRRATLRSMMVGQPGAPPPGRPQGRAVAGQWGPPRGGPHTLPSGIPRGGETGGNMKRRCECGTATGVRCARVMRQGVKLRFVEPHQRATAEALGSPAGLWIELRVARACAAELLAELGQWGDRAASGRAS